MKDLQRNHLLAVERYRLTFCTGNRPMVRYLCSDIVFSDLPGKAARL